MGFQRFTRSNFIKWLRDFYNKTLSHSKVKFLLVSLLSVRLKLKIS
jgi:hypothetical protein